MGRMNPTTGQFFAGTLACIVRKRGDTGGENVYLLSNKHVLFALGAGAGDAHVTCDAGPAATPPDRHCCIERSVVILTGDPPRSPDRSKDLVLAAVEAHRRQRLSGCAASAFASDERAFRRSAVRGRPALAPAAVGWRTAGR